MSERWEDKYLCDECEAKDQRITELEAENERLIAVYEAAKGISWPGPELEQALAAVEGKYDE